MAKEAFMLHRGLQHTIFQLSFKVASKIFFTQKLKIVKAENTDK